MFEIGNSLREARARRKVDFAQAEQATKIRGKYLRALEDEEFDVLPSPTYVKGFLRTYAEYLGLDGQLYVDEYNSRFVAGEDDVRVRRSVNRQRGNRGIETRVVLVALAAIALLAVFVFAAWKSSNDHPTVPTVAQQTRSAPVRRYVPTPLLSVRAFRGDSLLSVHQGGPTGRVRYEGTLLRGQTQEFGGKRLWLNIGSPENLQLRVHGKLVHVTGHRPRVIVVTTTGWRPA